MDGVTRTRIENGKTPDTLGWINIADVLGVTVRAAMAARKRGLPVVRRRTGGVAAWSDRLRAWQNGSSDFDAKKTDGKAA